MPLSFAAGETYQFDWTHEVIILNVATVIVKAGHMRLCHSQMLFIHGYPRETQEMVLDAHDHTFIFSKEHAHAASLTILILPRKQSLQEKYKQYNRRFLKMCLHCPVETVACMPASGWEKGQTETGLV